MANFWKPLTLISLVVVNAVLLRNYLTHESDAREAFLMLSENTYEEDRYAEILARELGYSLETKKAAALTLSLSEKITSVANTYLKEPGKMDAGEYFTQEISVTATDQKEVFDALHAYCEGYSALVDQFISKRKTQLQNDRDSVVRQFRRFESHLKASPNGKRLGTSIRYAIKLNDFAFTGTISGTKINDTIHWDIYDSRNAPFAGYQSYTSYLAWTNQKINSSTAFQAKKLINKLEGCFPAQGKILLYGKVFTLDRITLAQFNTIWRTINYAKQRSDIQLLDALGEFSRL